MAIVSFEGPHLNNVNVLASQTKSITIRKDGNCYEQYSYEIWQAICDCCQKCLEISSLSGESIHSIAFSATCSMVIIGELDENTFTSNSVKLNSKTGASAIPDVIMWMDHRAVDEAAEITKNYTELCEQFGGTASPEFSLSKLLWLHRHEPSRFSNAVGFMELPDWLVYKCIGLDPEACPRSLCSLACKWGYDPINCKWPEKLFKDCDMRDLAGGDYSRIGKVILKPGQRAGYLCLEAAIQLGLYKKKALNGYKERIQLPEVSIGTSLIDAHSGMLAMLSIPLEISSGNLDIQSTFCFLAGTSTCQMLLSKERICTKGIWGPYLGAVLDSYYLREAGQSVSRYCQNQTISNKSSNFELQLVNHSSFISNLMQSTGKLIEHTIETHPEGKDLLKTMDMKSVIELINRRLQDVGCKNSLHMVPSFHGNRSPLANPNLRGNCYKLSNVL